MFRGTRKRPATEQGGRAPKRRRMTGSYTRKARVQRNLTIPQLALRLFERKKRYRTDTEQSINTLLGYFSKTNAMDISQNDTYSGLEGHIIRGSGIKFDFWVKNNAITTMIVRYVIVCIRNGTSDASAFAAGTGVLEDDSGNIDVTSASQINKMQARVNRDKYQVIVDRKIKLGLSNATDGTDIAIRKHWIPLKGAAFTYDGSGVAPQRNIYAFAMWCVLGNSDETLGETVELNMGTNFYYVDP